MTIWILALNCPCQAWVLVLMEHLCIKRGMTSNDKGAMTKVPTLALMTHEGEGATSQNSVDFIPAEGGHTEVAWKKVFWVWEVNGIRYLRGRQGRLGKPMEIKSHSCQILEKTAKFEECSLLLRLCNTWFHYCLLASFGWSGSTSTVDSRCNQASQRAVRIRSLNLKETWRFKFYRAAGLVLAPLSSPCVGAKHVLSTTLKYNTRFLETICCERIPQNLASVTTQAFACASWSAVFRVTRAGTQFGSLFARTLTQEANSRKRIWQQDAYTENRAMRAVCKGMERWEIPHLHARSNYCAKMCTLKATAKPKGRQGPPRYWKQLMKITKS